MTDIQAKIQTYPIEGNSQTCFNDSTPIDPYPVSQLMNRYEKSRDVIYKRLECLNIKTHRSGKGKGNEKYITLEELYEMDALHQHVSNGGKLAEFSSSLLSADNANLQSDNGSNGAIGQSDNIGLQFENLQGMNIDQFLELAQLIVMMSRKNERESAESQDPFAHYDTLEKFAANGWEIHSRDLKALINQAPRGNLFYWGGFLFTRVRSRWWTIEKSVRRNSSLL